jgi:hypothetical protein
MITILAFVARRGDFDDEACQVMGDAFDLLCEDFHDTGKSAALVRELIATRIIQAAAAGERDPIRLYNVGKTALGYDKRVA